VADAVEEALKRGVEGVILVSGTARTLTFDAERADERKLARLFATGYNDKGSHQFIRN
jgi:hypothetical protein